MTTILNKEAISCMQEDKKRIWSITVNGNWGITLNLKMVMPIFLYYEDYH